MWVLCAPSDDVDRTCPACSRRSAAGAGWCGSARRSPTPSPRCWCREGADAGIAALAARAAQGHVGRARGLATDEQARLLRVTALHIARRVATVPAASPRPADLVAAASERADAETKVRDAEETSALKEQAAGLGASAATRRAAGRPLPSGLSR